MTDLAVPVEAVAMSPAPPGAAAPQRSHLRATLHSAGLRAARTFTQAFIAVLTASPVLHLNVSVVKTAATAGFAAVLTLAQRWLDDTNVPTIPAG